MTAPTPRSVLRSPAFWIAAGVAARHAVGAWQLRSTLRFLSQPQPQPDGDSEPGPRVHLIVPVLREQDHIPDALAWFTHLLRELPWLTLTVVTTEREARDRARLATLVAAHTPAVLTDRSFPQLSAAEVQALNASRTATPGGRLTRAAALGVLDRFPSTAQVIDEHLSCPQYADLPVRRVHYPGDGRKAAQVNYAVAGLSAEHHDYIAVYDVDSRPGIGLLRQTRAFVQQARLRDGELPPVVQQSARFATSATGRSGWQQAACRGAARMQTLWTLRREIPSFRRYATATRRRNGRRSVDAVRRGLAQTVGHGLLVRRDVFDRVGGLPEFTVLDDLPFGYRLTMAGIPVEVMPTTTTAPAPEDVPELLALQRRWFRNYLDYPRCAAAARADGHGTVIEHAVALGVAAHRGATWALATPATVACLTFVVGRTRWPVRALAGAGLWLGCVTPVRMLATSAGRRPPMSEQARDSAELLAGYLLRSLGTYAAMFDAVTSHDTTAALAPKTNRRASRDPMGEPS